MSNVGVRGAGAIARRVAATTLFVVAFASGWRGVFWGADWALRASQLPKVRTTFALIDDLRIWRERFARDRRHVRVAFLGDSKLMTYGGPKAVPEVTEDALRRSGATTTNMRVHALRWSAMTIAGQYCIADEIVAARPDIVVLELNLQFFGPARPDVGAFPELAGWIRSARLWEAAWLPLSYTGITLNRLLFYRLLTVGGMVQPWAAITEYQGRLFKLREPLETWIEGSVARVTGHDAYTERNVATFTGILKRVLVPWRHRYNRFFASSHLGSAIDGVDPKSPKMRILEALLETYRRAGIRTVLWVAPLNVDQLRVLGFPTDGLTRTVAVVRKLADANGVTVVDDHALLSDAEFVDSGDHFSTAGTLNGAFLAGNEVAAAIVKIAPPAPPRKPPTRAPRRTHALQ